MLPVSRLTGVVFSLLLFITAIDALAALQPHVRFRSLSMAQGLSQLKVYSIAQDHRGFIWVATDDGLNRYDGYEFKVYRPDIDDPHSIISNQIFNVLTDSENTLWIGTAKGLAKYLPESDSFEHIALTTDTQGNTANQRVIQIFNDSKNRLWIGTENYGLKRYDRNTGDFIEYPPVNRTANAAAQNTVIAITEGNDGKIWVATYDGLHYLAPGDTRLSRFRYAKDNKLSSEHIYSMLLDEEYLWLGTSYGLNRVHVKSGIVTKFFYQSQNLGISNNKVSFLHKDNQQNLWIATFNGITRYDLKSGLFYQYQQNSGNPYSIKGQIFSTIFEDRSGLLWFGSIDAGLSVLDRQSSQFGHFNTSNLPPECLSGNSIYAADIDDEDNLWLGAWGGGLHKIHWPTKRCKHFVTKDNDPTSLPSYGINVVHVDSRDDVWLGTLNEGLSRLDQKSNQFNRYQHVPDNPNSPTRGSIFTIVEDANKNLWIGTAGGLNRFSLEQQIFTQYRHNSSDPDSLAGNYINVLMVDSEGMIWIGTETAGLDKFNPLTGKFRHFYSTDLGAIGQVGKILALHQDSQGNIWIGSSGHGLIKYQPGKEQFDYFKRSDGLPSNTIYSIVEDDQQKLWVTSNKGLTRFDINTNKTTNYGLSDGLQDLEFNLRGFFDDQTKMVFLTGSNGFNAFNPSDIVADDISPSLAITEFRLFNRVTPLSARHTSSGVLSNISEAKHIILSADDSVFTFQFSALHFADPERNQYAYRLEPFDIDWSYTDAKYRLATYTNIPAGQYRFRVRGSNKDGVWNEDGVTLQVTILPPLWLTWWAKTIYLIVLVTLPILLYRIRTKALRERTHQLERQVQQRTQELSKEKTVVEHLLSQKSMEFANMSHELRTPLSLILSAVKSLKQQKSGVDKGRKVDVIESNGLRLLRMVEQLLQMEKLKVNQLVEPKANSVRATVQVAVQSFALQAKENDITLGIERLEEVWLMAPEDMLETVIINLLSNAVKYTRPGGQVRISAYIDEKTRCVIAITDTGVGIAPEQQQVIFKRFERVLDAHTEVITGAGIGLALVKELVEVNGGTINVSSQPGVGSTFTVILPDVIDPPIQQEDLRLGKAVELESKHLALQLNREKQPDPFDKIESSGNRPVVLVIEDNPQMREFIGDIISEHYVCITAQNGEQGLAVALRELPDLIVSDINMPKMDGYQLSQAIRNDITSCHIPIILLTARGDQQSRIKGWQENIDDYITKPFDDQELLLRVASLLAVRDILKQRFSEQMRNKHSARPHPLTQSTYEQHKPEQKDGLSQRNQAFIDKMMKVIQSQFADPTFNVTRLSNMLALSDRQLRRKLAALSDLTAGDYIRQVRLDAACKLLDTGERINIVADSVGFSSPTYFGNCFKAQYGMSPSQYQKIKNA